jgi:ABC-type multidrug transport system ATPase subunit
LKNVYLELQAGELLGVMGHNGAGKTTLINVLSGLTSSSGGNARIFDSNLKEDLEKIRRKMGLVS